VIIKSNFKDFYDSAQSFGQNFDLRYIRTTKDIPFPKDGWDIPRIYTSRYTTAKRIKLYSEVIGFCGKIYPIIWAAVERNWKSDLEKICFSMDDVNKFLEPNLSKEAWLRFTTKSRWFYNYGDDQESCQHYFESILNSSEAYFDWFLEFNCPIWITQTRQYSQEQWKITLNPCLRPTEFFRVFSPPLAFQEIQMFLANQASPEKEIPKIDDKTMAEIKGFDKWSFRKPPSKK
jgi:hypothetical protein